MKGNLLSYEYITKKFNISTYKLNKKQITMKKNLKKFIIFNY